MLTSSELVPDSLVSVVAYTVIVAEILLCIGLFIPRLQLPAIIASICVVSGYLSFNMWKWTQGIGVPCNCFGALYKFAPYQMIIINIILLASLAGLLRSFSLRSSRKMTSTVLEA